MRPIRTPAGGTDEEDDGRNLVAEVGEKREVVQRVEDTRLPEGHHLDDDRHQTSAPNPSR